MKELMTDAIRKVAEALNPENRARFEALPRAEQERFVHAAIDRGAIAFKIGGADAR